MNKSDVKLWKSDVELWKIWRGKDHKTKERDLLIILVQKLSKSIEKPWRNLRKHVYHVLSKICSHFAQDFIPTFDRNLYESSIRKTHWKSWTKVDFMICSKIMSSYSILIFFVFIKGLVMLFPFLVFLKYLDKVYFFHEYAYWVVVCFLQQVSSVWV